MPLPKQMDEEKLNRTMKKDEFLGNKFPDTAPYSLPIDENEVKYLLLRQASWDFMLAIQTQQAKQIADVLVPFALACKCGNPVRDGNTFEYPDFTTEDGLKEIFDETFCKKIAKFVRKGVKDAV